MHYLTVQDVLWVNFQITKGVSTFDAETLESAVYHQFGYGKSIDVLAQAAKFILGFERLKPFEVGNMATCLVCVASFLELNGYEFSPVGDGAVSWIEKVAGYPDSSLDALKSAVEVSDHTTHKGIQERCDDVLKRLASATEALEKNFEPVLA